MTLHRKFQARLRQAIDDGHGVTALARRSGYSRKHIRAVANGERTNPTLAFVEAIAGVIGMNPIEMLGGRNG